MREFYPTSWGGVDWLCLAQADSMALRSDDLTSDVRDQLRDLGVVPGGVLIVHAAFSKVGPVEGGPEGLIAALRAALGAEGTLVMPSMSDNDEHVFDPATHAVRAAWGSSRRRSGACRASCAATARTRSPRWGRRRRRSRRRTRSTCRTGRTARPAASTTATARCCCWASATTRTPPSTWRRSWRPSATGCPKWAMVLRDGVEVRHDYDEIDHCCERFALVDGWLDAEQPAAARRGRQRPGPPGARARHRRAS